MGTIMERTKGRITQWDDMPLDPGIHEILAGITGVDPESTEEAFPDHTRSLMGFRVRTIILVSSVYDYFLLEEEGRLSDLFRKVYETRELGYVPQIVHVSSGERALTVMREMAVDLVVAFNPPSDMDVYTLAGSIKQERGGVPFVYLVNNTPELERIASRPGAIAIDRIFTWYGDGAIFLTITNYIEDRANLDHNHEKYGVRYILVVEDSIQRYSKFLPLMYELIWSSTDSFLQEELTRDQRRMRILRRPKVILEPDGAKAMDLERELGDHLLFTLLGTSIPVPDETIDPKDGPGGSNRPEVRRLRIVSNNCLTTPHRKGEVPSSAGGKGNEPENSPPGFPDGVRPQIEAFPYDAIVAYDSPTFPADFRKEVQRFLGPFSITLSDRNPNQSAEIHDMWSLRNVFRSADDREIDRLVSTGELRPWLMARTEFELADGIDRILARTRDAREIRNSIRVLLDHRGRRAREGSIPRFVRRSDSATVSSPRFSRIGSGPLGGKARGLAFMNRILSTYLPDSTFQNVRVFIPRTLVLATDVFDTFMEENELYGIPWENLPDSRIAARFMAADLPPSIVGDLRDFITDLRSPIIIRSSSLLEDALFQPFAGVYASVMLPNAALERDKRCQEMFNAIKFVYASTFCRKARDYIRTTPNRIEDEKMGVVIQEVVGRRYGSRYYSTVTGVMKSFNYFPVGRCRADEGIANLALGLGKTIVDGGMAYRFCPRKPKVNYYSSLKVLLEHSQKTFFAIDLSPRTTVWGRQEDTSLINLDLSEAERDGVLDHVASTYVQAEDRLYPGISKDGARVLDFSPLIQYEKIPLPGLLRTLMELSQTALGCPVEIEFAMNIDPDVRKPADLAFLQVRSMVALKGTTDVDLDDIPGDRIVCSCANARGNGIEKGLHDIVFVKPDTFTLSRTQVVARQIRETNKRLIDESTSFILMGPGRWGSSDPWLGIPVAWSDISGARTIIEMPVQERIIDPSEGSHFFHNMTSSRVGYFTMSRDLSDRIDWPWLGSLEVINEKEDVLHVRSPTPLEVRIDGRSGRGMIIR